MANGNFGGGYGTASSPFLVEDVADLQAISNHLNRNFKQVRDIDLSKIERWEAIGVIGIFGNVTRFNSFTGSFDGNGYVIKNMKIVDDRTKYEPVVGGLFAGMQNATIINVTVEDVFIDVSSTRVGILAHQTNGNAVITNCKVRNCNVNTTAPGIGGLVYVTFRGSLIEDCDVSDVLITHNTGDFYTTGNIGEMQPIGGLVGQAYEGGSKNLKTTISRCAVKNIEMIRKNTSVWVDHSYADVGGLIGQCDRGNIIKDCYVQGYMKDKEIHSNQKLGGLIGFFVGDGESQIINCYAAVKADIDWKLSEKDANYGGLFAFGVATEHDSIVNSYYDQQLFNGGNGFGESRTTSTMKNKANYIDWDFDHVWAIRLNADYPFLHYRKDDIKYHMCKSTDFPLDIKKMKRR